MPYQNEKLPIGSLLKKAGLISEEQLETALNTQKQYAEMKLGEILVLREGIKAKTIDFFVNKWHEIIVRGKQFPLGYYLKNAYLLDEQQIEAILQQQQNNYRKFGTIAVQKGLIAQKTVDFFINSLPLKPPPIMSLQSLEKYNSSVLHLDKKYQNYSLILSRILAWTGGNIYLTKAICQVLVDSDANIPVGSEINAVDLCVEGLFVKQWQVSKPAEYIRAVRQQLVNNSRCSAKSLLEEYREILLSNGRKYQNTKEQDELILLGLILPKNNQLHIANIIYQRVFDRDFVAQELSKKQIEATSTNNFNTTDERVFIPKTSNTIPEQPASSLNHVQIQLNHNTEEKKRDDRKPKIKIPRLQTLILSLVAFSAIALLVPFFFNANKYYSSKATLEPVDPDREGENLDIVSEVDKFEQFCNEIDFSNSNATLSTISELEKNQQLLEEFPGSCETALNRLRVIAAPQLGQESRILEAVKHLCKIPGDSEMHLEAKVWIKHWYDSPDWGNKIDSYLDNFSNYKNFECAAAHFRESI